MRTTVATTQAHGYTDLLWKHFLDASFVYDDDARGRAHVARMVLFDRDCASGTRTEVVELVRRAREKLPAKPRVTSMLKKPLVF